MRNVLVSHGLHHSTFGDAELNYRVRNGIGWALRSMVTHTEPIPFSKVRLKILRFAQNDITKQRNTEAVQSAR